MLADVDHLHRVLINLLDNAIKYGAEPVIIDVALADDGVVLAVRDSGPGVAEDFRDCSRSSPRPAQEAPATRPAPGSA